MNKAAYFGILLSYFLHLKSLANEKYVVSNSSLLSKVIFCKFSIREFLIRKNLRITKSKTTVYIVVHSRSHERVGMAHKISPKFPR